MSTRMRINRVEPGVYEAMQVADKMIKGFDIEPKLKELIKIRVSQINGCGYCLNIHTADARRMGETEQRLYTLSAWRETAFFTEAEQAAFQLAEEVTLIAAHGVSDETYNKAVELLGERTTAQILLIILTINSWNRIALTTHMLAGKD